MSSISHGTRLQVMPRAAGFPDGAGHVLITTRRGGFSYLVHVLDLDVLPHPEAVTSLRRRVPALTDDQANALAALLGDLPLTLEEATAYLDQTRLPPPDYIHLLTTPAVDVPSRPGRRTPAHTRR